MDNTIVNSPAANILKSKMCRVCLETHAPLFDVQGKFDGLKGSIINAFRECAPVSILKEDCFPAFMCRGCVLDLIIAYKFRERAIISEKKLLQRFSQLLKYDETLDNQETIDSCVVKCEIEEPPTFSISSVFSLENENNEATNFEFKTVIEQCKDGESIDIKEKKPINIEEKKPIDIKEKKPIDIKKKEPSDIKEKEPSDIKIRKLRQRSSNTRNVARLVKKNKFICAICQKQFASSTELKTHTIDHMRQKSIDIDNKPYWCKICGTSFMKKWSLLSHHSIHTGEKPFACNFCDSTFRRKDSLTQHKLRLHKFDCQICNQSFRLSKELTLHKCLDGSELIKCILCNVTFSSKGNLQKHKRKFHGAPLITKKKSEKKSSPKGLNRSGVSEQDIQKNFEQLNALTAYKSKTRKPIVCGLCGKVFSSSGNLQRHQRNLHGGSDVPVKHERPECGICKKTFSKKSNLMQHMQVHTAKKC